MFYFFFLNQIKEFSISSLFYPLNQTHMRENQIFSILPLLIFYLLTFSLCQQKKKKSPYKGTWGCVTCHCI